MQLKLEIDASDSNVMESILSRVVKVIYDSRKIEIDVSDLDVLHSILRSGVKVDPKHKETKKAFQTAIQNNSYDICQILVKCGAVDVDVKDGGGMTPLLLAVMRGHEKVVRILIEAGSDVNQKGNYGSTALILAALRGNEKIMRILIEAGSDVNQKEDNGYTALMRSAFYGHAQISRILLENGADFTAKSSDGETALDRAKYSKDEETIELLEYAIRLRRSTLFIQSIEYLRNHRQEYEEEEVREYIPDHVMNGFFRNTIWKGNSNFTSVL